MQRVKPRLSRVQAYALLIAILILLGLGIWGVTRLFGPRDEAGVSASLLPCPYSEARLTVRAKAGIIGATNE